jgi:L-rhamnose-H+ transport protein
MIVLFGVILHLTGGFAAGSFYLPYRNVKGWSWESLWLLGGVFAWLVAPWVVALVAVDGLYNILSSASADSTLFTFLMGLLWGIGGLTFGLSMRYLGMSLGMAIALGYCSVFGTLIPPLFYDITGQVGEVRFSDLLVRASGLTTLLGVGVCLLGILLCGWAGMRKEKDMTAGESTGAVPEFNFFKGLGVASVSGILSACMAFGFATGKPIAEIAVSQGVAPLWQNTPVLVVILLGGFATNFIWCLYLNIRNRSFQDYFSAAAFPLKRNYLLCALGGLTWYLQFMFYGMGSTKMGEYDFASWTLHMAFIIVISNLWGFYLKEWQGAGRRTIQILFVGLGTVILSTVFVGIGNYLAGLGH